MWNIILNNITILYTKNIKLYYIFTNCKTNETYKFVWDISWIQIFVVIMILYQTSQTGLTILSNRSEYLYLYIYLIL